MTTETPTVDQLLELAHKLPREQRGQLIARLVLELTTEAPPPPATARALLAHAGTWAGDDLPERLADVYATRQPVEA